MSTKHLRTQAGGNPAQGPHPDVANPAPSPRAGQDFPDHDAETSTGRPEDQPDLDAFAARLGTDRLAAPEQDAADSKRDWRSPVATALGGLASGARTVGERLKGASEKLVSDGNDGELDLAALRARVGKVHTVMLTSVDERGTLSSRPLTVQHVADSGDVLFVVDRDADWVSATMDAANVAFVDGSTTWISVAGRAVLDEDPQLLDDLWSPLLDSYFPEGRAGAVVLRLQSDRWEYWTAPNQLVQLLEIARSKVSNDSPDLGNAGTVET